MPNAAVNRQILLVEAPKNKLGPEHFRLVQGAVPQPGEGQVLLRTRYISLDAANRAWMQGATYRTAVEANAVMAGGAIAEVVTSNAPGFAAGDLAFSDTGWQDYAVLPARQLLKMPRIEPITHLLSVYGIAGLTAYFGLLHVGKPATGETVVVSAAAGSVGSIVGQIAKIKGCRVIGIAGGRQKCDWVRDELGFDDCIDYKGEALFKSLKAAAPKGIDVYFDNVGGEILDAVLKRLRLHARIVLCGGISQYNATGEARGPANYLSLISARGRMEGFVIIDYLDRAAEAVAAMAPWVQAGKLKSRIDVVEGLEHFPEALRRVYTGANFGKQLLKV